jgi:hypothetical protein
MAAVWFGLVWFGLVSFISFGKCEKMFVSLVLSLRGTEGRSNLSKMVYSVSSVYSVYSVIKEGLFRRSVCSVIRGMD